MDEFRKLVEDIKSLLQSLVLQAREAEDTVGKLTEVGTTKTLSDELVRSSTALTNFVKALQGASRKDKNGMEVLQKGVEKVNAAILALGDGKQLGRLNKALSEQARLMQIIVDLGDEQKRSVQNVIATAVAAQTSVNGMLGNLKEINEEIRVMGRSINAALAEFDFSTAKDNLKFLADQIERAKPENYQQVASHFKEIRDAINGMNMPKLSALNDISRRFKTAGGGWSNEPASGTSKRGRPSLGRTSNSVNTETGLDTPDMQQVLNSIPKYEMPNMRDLATHIKNNLSGPNSQLNEKIKDVFNDIESQSELLANIVDEAMLEALRARVAQARKTIDAGGGTEAEKTTKLKAEIDRFNPGAVILEAIVGTIRGSLPMMERVKVALPPSSIKRIQAAYADLYASLDPEYSQRLASLTPPEPVKPVPDPKKNKNKTPAPKVEKSLEELGQEANELNEVVEKLYATMDAHKAALKAAKEDLARAEADLAKRATSPKSARRELARAILRKQFPDLSTEGLETRTTDLTKFTRQTPPSSPRVRKELEPTFEMLDEAATELADLQKRFRKGDTGAVDAAKKFIETLGITEEEFARISKASDKDLTFSALAKDIGTAGERIDDFTESLKEMDAQLKFALDKQDALAKQLIERTKIIPSGGNTASIDPVTPDQTGGLSAQRMGAAFASGSQRLADGAQSFGTGLLGKMLSSLSSLWAALKSIPEQFLSFAERIHIATKAAEDAMDKAIASTPFAGAYKAIKEFSSILAGAVGDLMAAGSASINAIRSLAEDINKAHAMMAHLAGGKYPVLVGKMITRAIMYGGEGAAAKISEDPNDWSRPRQTYTTGSDPAGKVFSADTTGMELTPSERASINHQVVLEAVKASKHGIAVLRNSGLGKEGLGHSSVAMADVNDPKGYQIRQFLVDVKSGLSVGAEEQNSSRRSVLANANYMEAVSYDSGTAEEAQRFRQEVEKMTAAGQKYGFQAAKGLTCSTAIVKAANMSGVIPESFLPAQTAGFNTATPESMIRAMAARNKIAAGIKIDGDPLAYTPVSRNTVNAMRGSVVPSSGQMDKMSSTFTKMDTGSPAANEQLGFIGKLIRGFKTLANFSFEALADAIEMINTQLRSIDVLGSFAKLTDAIKDFAAKLRQNMTGLDSLNKQLAYLGVTARDVGTRARKDVSHRVTRVVDRAREAVEDKRAGLFVDDNGVSYAKSRVASTSQVYNDAMLLRQQHADTFQSGRGLDAEQVTGLVEGSSSDAALQRQFEEYLASKDNFDKTNAKALDLYRDALAREVAELESLTNANKAAKDTFKWVEFVSKSSKPLSDIAEHDLTLGTETNTLFGAIGRSNGPDEAGRLIDDFMDNLKKLDSNAFRDFEDGMNKLKIALQTMSPSDADAARRSLSGAVATRYGAGAPVIGAAGGDVYSEFAMQIGNTLAAGFSSSEKFNAVGRTSASLLSGATTADDIGSVLSVFSGAVKDVDPVIFATLEANIRDLNDAVRSTDIKKFDAALERLSADIFSMSMASQAVSSSPADTEALVQAIQEAAPAGQIDTYQTGTRSGLSAMKSGIEPLDAVAKGYGAFTFYNSQLGASIKAVQQFAIASKELNTGTIVDMAGAVLKLGGAIQNTVYRATGERGRNDQNKPLFSGYAEKGRGDTILSFLDAGLRLFGGSLGIPTASKTSNAKVTDEEKTAQKAERDQARAARVAEDDKRRADRKAEREAERARKKEAADKPFATRREAAEYAVGTFYSRFKSKTPPVTRVAARETTAERLDKGQEIVPYSRSFTDFYRTLTDNVKKNLASNAEAIMYLYYKTLENNGLEMYQEEKERFAAIKKNIEKSAAAQRAIDRLQDMAKKRSSTPYYTASTGNVSPGGDSGVSAQRLAPASSMGYYTKGMRGGVEIPGSRVDPTAHDDIAVTLRSLYDRIEEEIRAAKRLTLGGETGTGLSAMLSGGAVGMGDDIQKFMSVLTPADVKIVEMTERAIAKLIKSLGMLIVKTGYGIMTPETAVAGMSRAYGENSDFVKSMKSDLGRGGMGGFFMSTDQKDYLGTTLAYPQGKGPKLPLAESTAHELTHLEVDPNKPRYMMPSISNLRQERLDNMRHPFMAQRIFNGIASAEGLTPPTPGASYQPSKRYLQYKMQPNEMYANVGQGLLGGNEQTQASNRAWYGNKLVDEITLRLQRERPEVYGPAALREVQQGWDAFEDTLAKLVRKAVKNQMEGLSAGMPTGSDSGLSAMLSTDYGQSDSLRAVASRLKPTEMGYTRRAEESLIDFGGSTGFADSVYRGGYAILGHQRAKTVLGEDEGQYVASNAHGQYFPPLSLGLSYATPYSSEREESRSSSPDHPAFTAIHETVHGLTLGDWSEKYTAAFKRFVDDINDALTRRRSQMESDVVLEVPDGSGGYMHPYDPYMSDYEVAANVGTSMITGGMTHREFSREVYGDDLYDTAQSSLRRNYPETFSDASLRELESNLTKFMREFSAIIREADLTELTRRYRDGTGLSAQLSGVDKTSTDDAVKRFVSSFDNEDTARVGMAEQSIMDLGKGTGIESIMKRGGYAVVSEQTLLEAFENAFGVGSKMVDDLVRLMQSPGGFQGAAFDVGGQSVGVSILGKDQTEMSAGQTAAHELTHVVTKQAFADTDPELFKKARVLSSARVRELQDPMNIDQAIKDARDKTGDQFKKILSQFPQEIAYYFDPQEVMANVGQAILTGSQEVGDLYRSLYGDKMFGYISKLLEQTAPDIYGGQALSTIQSRFGAFDQQFSGIVSGAGVSPQVATGTTTLLSQDLTPDQVRQNLKEAGVYLKNLVDGLDFTNIEAALAELQNNPAIGGIGSAIAGSLSETSTLFERIGTDALTSPRMRKAFIDFLQTPTLKSFKDATGVFGGIAGQRIKGDISGSNSLIDVVTRPVKTQLDNSLLYNAGASIRANMGPPDPYKYFDDFSDAFKKMTGETLSKKDFSVSETYDVESGLTQLSASARTASGATTQLTGAIDRFGRVDIETGGKFKQMMTRFREEIAQEIPETVIEGFIYGLTNGLQELFTQVMGIQDEISQVNILMSAGAGAGNDPNFDSLKESQRFVQGAIELAAKTGQGFEESIRTIIQNFRTLGAVTDNTARADLATKLTEIQLGSQTVFNLSLEKSLEIIPSIFSQLKDQVAGAPGGDAKTPEIIARDATTQLESLMDKLVVAQRESGANAEDLIQVYADLSSSAKDKGISSDDLIALSASSSVKLGETPETTSNIMKMFLERLYSAEGASALGQYGVAVREQDPNDPSKLRFRDIGVVLDDINAVISKDAAAGSAISQVLGAQKNAPEASMILASRAEGVRVSNALATDVNGQEYEQQLSVMADKFVGNINSVKANIGSFIETVFFSSGLLNDFGAALEKISGYALSMAKYLTENSDIMKAWKPYIAALGQALIFIAVDAGKAFGGFVGTLNKVLMSTKNVVTAFQNQAFFPEDNMLRGAKATIAVIDELERMQRQGTLTDSVLQEAAKSIGMSFQRLGLDIDEVKASLIGLGAEAQKQAITVAVASANAASGISAQRVTGRSRITKAPNANIPTVVPNVASSSIMQATQLGMFDEGVNYAGRQTPLYNKPDAERAVMAYRTRAIAEAEAEAQAAAQRALIMQSASARTVTPRVSGRSRLQPSMRTNTQVPAQASQLPVVHMPQQLGMASLLAEVDAMTAAASAAALATQANTQAVAVNTTTDLAETATTRSATSAKSLEAASTKETVAGLGKLKVALTGFVKGTNTGVSGFWDTKIGRGGSSIGSMAMDLALPVATDVALNGGVDAEGAINIGAGIAGGIAGTLLTGGNPLGTMIGYQMSKAFAESIDIPGMVITSGKEKEQVTDFFAGVLTSNTARETATKGMTPEATAKYDEEQKKIADEAEKERLANLAKARAVIGKALGPVAAQSSVSLKSARTYLDMTPEERAAEQKRALAYEQQQRDTLKYGGAESAYGSALMNTFASNAETPTFSTAELSQLDALMKTLEQYPGVMDEIKKSTNGANLTVKDIIDLLMNDPEVLQNAINKSATALNELGLSPKHTSGIAFIDTASGILDRFAEKVELVKAAYESATTVPDEELFLNTSAFGSGMQRLDEQYAPSFDAIDSGTLTGDAASQKMDAYNRAKDALVGIPQLESTTSYVAGALGQEITDLAQSLYDMGAEGQSAFQGLIGPMADMIASTQEYEAKLAEIEYIKSNPLYTSGAGSDPSEYNILKDRLAVLEAETAATAEKYSYESKYLALVAGSKTNLQDQLTSITKQTKAKARLVSPGTPAEFRMPSLVDVGDYSAQDIKKALQAARSKQSDITKMFPQMAKEFAKEQFMLTSGSQYSGVTGVSQDYFNQALQDSKASKLEVPGTVDMSTQTPEQVQKILADARAMQNQAVALAPDLAAEYKDDRLLIMQKNNQLLLENGLSQEYLQAAIDANTKSTDENSDGLRGHYNLPSSYRAPTVWDYYDQGGKEAGTNNFVPPPGGGGITMDMATNIANAILAQGSAAPEGGPNLGELGSLIDPTAPVLGYPDPGTAPVWEMPPEFNTDDLYAKTLNIGTIGQYGQSGLTGGTPPPPVEYDPTKPDGGNRRWGGVVEDTAPVTVDQTLGSDRRWGGVVDESSGEVTDPLGNLKEKADKTGASMDVVCKVTDELTAIAKTNTTAMGLFGTSITDTLTKQSSGVGLVSLSATKAASGLDGLVAAVGNLNAKLNSYDPLTSFSNALNSGRIQITVNGQPATVTTTVTTGPKTGRGSPSYTGTNGAGSNNRV